MKNKKKTIIVMIPIILLIVISGLLSIITYRETKKMHNYFEGEEQTAIIPLVTNQESINKRLDAISNDARYTFEQAYVELNPYKISPLSAIIIYSSKSDESVEVYINGKKVTKMDASKKHIIPIYGLYEDMENKVKLVANNMEIEYSIRTEASNIAYPLEVLEKSEKINNEDIYFTVASYATWLTGWDDEGKLRFYLTEDMRMDVEWLDNGHFIIGTSQGQFAENFLSFVEMDYLGKIYNYYTMKNGFSFESQILNNGNIMSAGGVTPVYVKEQLIYEMNPMTGEVVSDVNLAKIFKEIDPEFDDTYLGQKAIRNGFYLNEKNNEMIVSFRGIDTVFCVDYKEKKLKWIFTNPNNKAFKSAVWDQYRINSKKDNYPWGQHSPKITSEGYIAFFNNGYERINGFEAGGPDEVSNYKNNYSRAEIYEIKNMEAKLVWSYDADKKLFSHQYGSIDVYENNSKLVNFGYVLDDDYRATKGATLSTSEKKPDHIYSLIIEFDKNDNIIFKAKCEEGKYRAFKHNLYNEETSSMEVTKLNIFNSIEADNLIEKNTKDINLEDTVEWINSCDFTKNTFKTDFDIKENDEVKLYFVNKAGKINVLTYKEKDNSQINRIFNVELNGKYALYIDINGTVYNTKKTIQF